MMCGNKKVPCKLKWLQYANVFETKQTKWNIFTINVTYKFQTFDLSKVKTSAEKYLHKNFQNEWIILKKCERDPT